MNLKSNFQRTLHDLKALEGKYSQAVKTGSKDPMDFHYMSYFSGTINGFRFVWEILDNHYTQKEYDEVVEVLKQTEVVN